jgi:ABC-type sugar transport system permease subunit
VLFGGALGVLYAVTTISGPPLAVVLSNQGLTKKDFRAALGFIRLAESSFTAIAYYYAGLYTVESFGLIPYILPSIAIGVPIGAVLIQKIRPETFRRVCMSFDAWVVGFGLSALLQSLKLVESNAAYLLLAGVGVLDTYLLYRFFSITLPALKQADPEALGAQPPPRVVVEPARIS